MSVNSCLSNVRVCRLFFRAVALCTCACVEVYGRDKMGLRVLLVLVRVCVREEKVTVGLREKELL